MLQGLVIGDGPRLPLLLLVGFSGFLATALHLALRLRERSHTTRARVLGVHLAARRLALLDARNVRRLREEGVDPTPGSAHRELPSLDEDVLLGAEQIADDEARRQDDFGTATHLRQVKRVLADVDGIAGQAGTEGMAGGLNLGALLASVVLILIGILVTGLSGGAGFMVLLGILAILASAISKLLGAGLPSPSNERLMALEAEVEEKRRRLEEKGGGTLGEG